MGWAGASLGAGLALIYTVPYLFAHADGHSESYLAHYSNHAALLLVLATAVALGWGTDVFGLRYAEGGGERGSRWPLGVMAAVSVLLVGAVWALERRVGAAGEATYFLDRYAQGALGGRLYTDLEFSYGPLLFWPQVWLAHATGLGFGDAHFVVLAVQWPAGLALLWYCCGRLAARRRDAVTLFVLLSLGWSSAIVDGGVNYTPLRFMAAPALALWVWGRWREGRGWLEVLGLALVGFWGLLFFSPEQGIAFGFGTVVFLVLGGPPPVGGLAGFVVGCGLGLGLALRLGVLNTLLSIGGGSLDFPLLPSGRMTVLLAGVVVAGALAVGALRRRERMPAELYLSALCVALLPAALGRCDPGHVFINLLPLLGIVFCAMAWTPGGYRLASAALAGYVVVAGALHVGPFAKAEVWRVQHRAQLGVPAGAYGGRLLAPMGFARAFNERVPAPVVTGRYSIYVPLLNGAVPGAKVEELRREPGTAVVLPANWRERCVVGEKGRREELKAALHPWVIPPARARDTSAGVLCEYLEGHYGESGKVAPAAGFVVLDGR